MLDWFCEGGGHIGIGRLSKINFNNSIITISRVMGISRRSIYCLDVTLTVSVFHVIFLNQLQDNMQEGIHFGTPYVCWCTFRRIHHVTARCRWLLQKKKKVAE